MAVRFTSRIKQWTSQTEHKLDLAVLDMVTDIHRQAGVLAPKLTRALVNSGKIIRNRPGSYTVRFGGGPVRYARRRHFENRKHPGTLRYLERAGDNVSRNVKRYIRENV